MLQPGSLAAKIVALGLLGIVLLAGNQFGVQPLLGAYQRNNDDIARSHELLQRYQALVAEKPMLTERLAALESEDTASTAYLSGTSDALAAAELQDLATEMIEITGGEIRSAQSLPAIDVEDGPALRKAGVNLRFSTDIDGLAEALYELETGEPVLFIDLLQVSAEGSRREKEAEESVQMLDVRLDVFGFIRRPE
ncbi:MAG: type II secretion system protein GspM [Geminicoccaceae bacterium]